MKCLVSDSIFVGVQMEASCRDSESKELRPETRQLSVVGAGRIAVRSSFIWYKRCSKQTSNECGVYGQMLLHDCNKSHLV